MAGYINNLMGNRRVGRHRRGDFRDFPNVLGIIY